MELMLILIVALAVFGPDKLPGMGAKLGRAMRDMRKATRAFSEEITTPAKEIMEPLQEIQGAVKSVGEAAAVARNPAEAIRQSVNRELNYKPEPAAEGEPAVENRIAPPAAEQAAGLNADQLAADGPETVAPEAVALEAVASEAAPPETVTPEAAAPEAHAAGPSSDSGEVPQPPPDPDPLEKA